ncbi:hypothetical protein AFCDBAGC_1302 [Methylobacterium cerastii]|uniref:Calcium-binding protein n=1 Tax=Methylobacterium cerastii TaxID=932741 RepID=A0ABQ4QF36_9HYPH|nr:hypothetical protein [Methylobacterium cerastii]GJD43450.1 hypothetical protein AFCDBAGC_1302 [Methylobacterium cerastii]
MATITSGSSYIEAQQGDTSNPAADLSGPASNGKWALLTFTSGSSVTFKGNFSNTDTNDFFAIGVINGTGSLPDKTGFTVSISGMNANGGSIALQGRLEDYSYYNTYGPYGATEFLNSLDRTRSVSYADWSAVWGKGGSGGGAYLGFQVVDYGYVGDYTISITKSSPNISQVDLTPSITSLSPSTVQGGQSAVAGIHVANIGSAISPTSGFDLDFYMASLPNLNDPTTNAYLGSVHLNQSIAAGSSLDQSISMTFPTQGPGETLNGVSYPGGFLFSGTYYLYAWVNRNQAVAESNFNNDVTYTQVAYVNPLQVNGTAGNDTLYGTAQNDGFDPGKGDDDIYAGAGFNTLRLHASRTTTTALRLGSEVGTVNADGHDVGTNIDQIKFDDITILTTTLPQFDPYQYLASNLDVLRTLGNNQYNAFHQYIRNGVDEKRSTATFNTAEYLASNPDLISTLSGSLAAGVQHFVNSGFQEGRPTSTFDVYEYLASNIDLIATFRASPTSAAGHYVSYGYNEHRNANSFNPWEYLASNVDLLRALGPNALAAEQHYVNNGFAEGRPTATFDALRYIASNVDLIRTIGNNALVAQQHFDTYGFKEGRPTATFDAYEYLASNLDLLPVVGRTAAAGVAHYVSSGFSEGRSTSSFDAYAYLASNPDLIGAFGPNPSAAAQHYVNYGIAEHRPEASFNAYEYLDSNPDVLAALGSNIAVATQHFVKNGYAEHRPTQSFDALEYIASNPDLARALGVNIVAGQEHYAKYGYAEHRATQGFDGLRYLASNPDLARTFGADVVSAEKHYITNGLKEGRSTTSFNPAQYLANYKDLQAAFGDDPIAAEVQYITRGLSEGRIASVAPGSTLGVFMGDAKDNRMVVGAGDTLTGGGGHDVFVLKAPPSKPAFITDFHTVYDSAEHDKIEISVSGFGYTGQGSIGGGYGPYHVNGPASLYLTKDNSPAGVGSFLFFHDSTNPNDTNGTIYYDPNGGNSSNAVALVHVTDFGLRDGIFFI